MATGLIDRLQDKVRALRRPSAPHAGTETEPGQDFPAVDLAVTNGLHKGATLDLNEADYTIGSQNDADIVLKDAGIAPIHARLRCKGRRVEIEALGGPVTLQNGEIIPQDHGRRCSLPVEVGIGGAKLHLGTRRQRLASMRLPVLERFNGGAWRRDPLFASASVFVIVLVSSLALNQLSSATPVSTQARRPVKAAAGLMDWSDAAPDAPPARSPASNAREALAARLADAGFANLTVETEDDHLLVSGSLPQGKDEAWRSVQAWFDQSYGDRIPLISRVVVDRQDQSPPLTLRAIWFGDKPYIITADGMRYHEGAFIAGGWTIEKIGKDDLKLARNGSTVTLKYR